MEKNKVKLNICGTDYFITSEDAYDYVVSIGENVDAKINNILEKNPKISIAMASILATLEYCDSASKSTVKIESLKDEVKRYFNELSEQKDLYEIALSEIDFLKNKEKELTLKANRVDNLEAQTKKYVRELVDLQNKYDTTYLKLKESEKLVTDLISKNKNEVEKLTLKNQQMADELNLKSLEYQEKIKALEEELIRQRLNKPISEIITYSNSQLEIADSDS